LGGRLIFTAPDGEYENLHRLLLASRLDATVSGRHFEQAEIWSERRALLAIVRIERHGE
jgi:glyoxylase-like metal-dependent hydrolase (beta-lactamase superfamily II)